MTSGPHTLHLFQSDFHLDLNLQNCSMQVWRRGMEMFEITARCTAAQGHRLKTAARSSELTDIDKQGPKQVGCKGQMLWDTDGFDESGCSLLLCDDHTEPMHKFEDWIVTAQTEHSFSHCLVPPLQLIRSIASVEAS